MSLVNLTLPPATIFLRVHDPKSFGDDISARRAAVVESNRTGKPIVGVEMGRDTLSIFAMTPIMRDGKSLGLAENGVPFGKEFVDRAKLRFGVDLAVHSFDGKELKRLSSTFGDAVIATPEELKSVFTAHRCAAMRRSAAVPPPSISGRSRITPASRSRCWKSSRTPPNTRRRRRVRSAT